MTAGQTPSTAGQAQTTAVQAALTAGQALLTAGQAPQTGQVPQLCLLWLSVRQRRNYEYTSIRLKGTVWNVIVSKGGRKITEISTSLGGQSHSQQRDSLSR